MPGREILILFCNFRLKLIFPLYKKLPLFQRHNIAVKVILKILSSEVFPTCSPGTIPTGHLPEYHPLVDDVKSRTINQRFPRASAKIWRLENTILNNDAFFISLKC